MCELRNSTKYVPRYKLEEKIQKEAKELGITVGLKTGRNEKAKEMAAKCLKDGFDIELIARLTGLSVRVIENLKQKME